METTEENHILMLTILLVHESSHLINYQVCNNLKPRKSDGIYVTPEKKFKARRGFITLDDFGHMIEWILFGYVIQHTIDRHFPAPFTLKHIIGCYSQRTNDGFIVSPSSELRQIIKGNNSVHITAEILQLVPGDEFQGRSAEFKISSFFRASEPGHLILSGMVVESENGSEGTEDFDSSTYELLKSLRA